MAESAAVPFLSGIILAAGASVRLGHPKQLLTLDGRPLLQHVLSHAATAALAEIIVVLGHRAVDIEAALDVPADRAVRIVHNPDFGEGQSTSLRVGLRAADARAVGAAILLGDQPGITGVLIDQVAAAAVAADARVARPVFRDATGRRVPGHPVFLARRVWWEAELLTGDQGARGIVAAHPDWLLEVEVDGDPPQDVDTWEDYRRITGGS